MTPPPAAHLCPRCHGRLTLERTQDGDEWSCSPAGCGYVGYDLQARRAAELAASQLRQGSGAKPRRKWDESRVGPRGRRTG